MRRRRRPQGVQRMTSCEMPSTPLSTSLGASLKREEGRSKETGRLHHTAGMRGHCQEAPRLLRKR